MYIHISIYTILYLWSIFKRSKLYIYILFQDSSLMMATPGWNHHFGIFWLVVAGVDEIQPDRQVLWGRVKHIPLAKTILVRFHRACCMISKWSAQLFTRVMRQLQLPSESDSCAVKWAVHHLLANISHTASCQVSQTPSQKSSPFLSKWRWRWVKTYYLHIWGELSFTICYLGYQGFDP